MTTRVPPEVVAQRLTGMERDVLLDVCRAYAISRRPSTSMPSNNSAFHSLVNYGLLDVAIAVCARLYTPTSYGKRVGAHVSHTKRKRRP